jgi:sulfofructose kinase
LVLTEPPPRILCAGIAVQDIVMRVASFPAPGAKVPAADFIVTGGGCAANAAVAVARLGGRAAYAGPLGDESDAVSNRILADLAAAGVDCGGVCRLAGGTASVSLILIDAGGEKSVATRRGSGLGEAGPADAAALIANVDIVLADNRLPAFVTPVAEAARARNRALVLDLDLAGSPEQPLLKLASHVIASSEALRGSLGVENLGEGLKHLAGHTSAFLAVTDGANGVYWLEEGAVRHRPGFAVEAVDTLAAGDIFHGAFALALAEGADNVSALNFANAAAALKCMRFGGAAGAPARTEVEALLARQ